MVGNNLVRSAFASLSVVMLALQVLFSSHFQSNPCNQLQVLLGVDFSSG